MGANQSGQQAPSAESAQRGGILVVNPNPDQSQAQIQELILPKRVPPVLSVEGYNIDTERHPKQFQLDESLWVDYVTAVNEFANSRAHLVADRQCHLTEKISSIDVHIQRFTDSYVNETHKALARMNDDCRRVEEINKLLHKCKIQSELCLDMLNKLNYCLPDEHKLETLEA